ncbi:MAG: preprotein translocase subunit SecA [Steroidobacteraceae bacterium]|nr:preprotein translocase subunit SecA [Steroidobacteraceae bacterium]
MFGSRNQRLLRQYAERVRRANGFADALAALSDEALRGQTEKFRARLAGGETLDDLLPEAFATAREAATRAVGLRPFDVQLIGGMVLHEGKISEMRTGEGKTLVATLPVYLNALAGKGVHVVTVNEYLAQRDAEWMGPIYRALGLSVGVITSGQPPQEKRAAYACDVTYGTNNEYGFDYLRDNLAQRLEDRVQRGQHYAIVDEVDSILIDEARTPLIISGPAEESTELYVKINALVPKFRRQSAEEGEGDFFADEKSRQVHLSETGFEKAEELMQQAGLLREGDSLYDAASIRLMHHLNAALRAHTLYHRDVEYIVRNGEVIIVDEFTGRTMPGRRWSDGLHQAVEAKEGVRIREENQTIASITFQNYFRLYPKLAGMTGTADTEAFEFQQIYGLEVVVVPTHRPMIRKDLPDLVYLNQKDKFDAIVEDIRDCVKRGQPALVGTTSIDTSEKLSGFLKEQGIAHAVLNAKQHDREAMIIAQAGRPGTVTIATNMAGRGTDIVLGGNVGKQVEQLRKDGVLSGDELAAKTRELEGEWQRLHEQVIAAGGLHIIGTERHESRRIDNQLRGRSGRQGDPGSSRFYLSLEDNLMRIFGDPQRTKSLLRTVGMREGEAIESGMLTRQIERAQRKVESHNFDARKNLLEYDDVANDQRKVIYRQRTEIMSTDDIGGVIRDVRTEVVQGLVDQYIPPDSVEEQWDVAGLEQAVERDFGVRTGLAAWLAEDPSRQGQEAADRLLTAIEAAYEEKVQQVGAPVMRHLERAVMLQQLDVHWREHLAAMDYLRQGIYLRAYAQKNPKQEYKREAFALFTAMLERIRGDTVMLLQRLQVRSEEEIEREEAERRRRLQSRMQLQHAPPPELAAPVSAAGAEPAPGRGMAPPVPPPESTPFVRGERKIGRNEPCPCGSGRKYKHCHGALQHA